MTIVQEGARGDQLELFVMADVKRGAWRFGAGTLACPRCKERTQVIGPAYRMGDSYGICPECGAVADRLPMQEIR